MPPATARSSLSNGFIFCDVSLQYCPVTPTDFVWQGDHASKKDGCRPSHRISFFKESPCPPYSCVSSQHPNWRIISGEFQTLPAIWRFAPPVFDDSVTQENSPKSGKYPRPAVLVGTRGRLAAGHHENISCGKSIRGGTTLLLKVEGSSCHGHLPYFYTFVFPTRYGSMPIGSALFVGLAFGTAEISRV